MQCEVMKKYLFGLFCFGAFCEVSFTKIYADVVPKDRYKSSYSERSPETMSDAELSRLMGELAGETPEDFSEAVVDSKGDVVLAETSASDGVSSKTAKSGNFPTGFWIGIGVAQSWDVARNHTTVWYAKEKNEERGFYNPDMPKFVKTNRARLDPGIEVGYSFLFGNGIWIGIAGKACFGSSHKRTIGSPTKYKEECKVDGLSYSLALKPGYLIKEYGLVLYSILGVKWRKISSEPKGLKQLTVSQNKTGPVFGMGFEKQIFKNLSFNFEYEHCWRSSSFKREQDSFEVDGGYSMIAREGKASFRSNSVTFGLRYYF